MDRLEGGGLNTFEKKGIDTCQPVYCRKMTPLQNDPWVIL